jgi:adenosylcobinamide-phosphate synthase
MDSMFGYKNERYLHFGRTAALLDDVVNYIPARLTGLSLVAGAFFLKKKKNGARAWKILRRDRKKHASPNAGYPESAMAGALGLQLGGDAVYFGQVVPKPTLGDPIEKPDEKHIKAAVKIMIFSSFFCVSVLSLLCFVVMYW